MPGRQGRHVGMHILEVLPISQMLVIIIPCTVKNTLLLRVPGGWTHITGRRRVPNQVFNNPNVSAKRVPEIGNVKGTFRLALRYNHATRCAVTGFASPQSCIQPIQQSQATCLHNRKSLV